MPSIREFLHIDAFFETLRGLTWRELLLITVAVLMVISGNAGQLIVLNLWVAHMGLIPPPETPLSILTISASTMAVFFIAAILVRAALNWRTISFRFLLSRKGLVLSVVIGMCNALNGVLLVYATPATSEILQALLLCTQVFWTLAGSKLLLNDSRSILNFLVIGSFVCVAGGIVLGASPTFSQSSPTTSSTKWWTCIFAASMIPGALYNVFASMYMRAFTQVDEPKEVEAEDEYPLLVNQSESEDVQVRSDSTTVKLTMLATTGLSQMLWMFVFMPLNAAPWFGSSDNIAETREMLKDGWSCVFQREFGCTRAYVYYILFNVSYFVNYLGSAYLNHFSATLNSMVTQLSSPIAAIVLLAAPSLNVGAQAVEVGPSIGAIILLMMGSSVFTLWEQGTRKKIQ
jgi:drug/metabolite transporter (DMT)-like permease